MSINGNSKKPSSQECRSILHVGAHRTGTTLFQEFLYRRRNFALDKGVRFIETVECRRSGLLNGLIYNRSDDRIYLRQKQLQLKENLKASLDQNIRLVLSDENILGTIQKCARTGSLYPDVSDMVARLGSVLEVFDTILISIRPIHLWWRSVQGFLQKSGRVVEPNLSQRSIDSLLEGRTWSQVIQDIISVAGRKRIIVRDFEYLVANPKRQLLHASKWSDLKDIPSIERKITNASLPIVVDSSADQQGINDGLDDFLTNLSIRGRAVDLHALYLKDLEEIKKIIGRDGRILRAKQ